MFKVGIAALRLLATATKADTIIVKTAPTAMMSMGIIRSHGVGGEVVVAVVVVAVVVVCELVTTVEVVLLVVVVCVVVVSV